LQGFLLGQNIWVGQSYYAVVIALGVANVVLAVIAYQQRCLQLAGRQLHEAQIALAEQRNQMAAERIDLLDQQVAPLTAIRDVMAAQLQAREERPAPAGGLSHPGEAA
jgi:hypothetical protein